MTSGGLTGHHNHDLPAWAGQRAGGLERLRLPKTTMAVLVAPSILSADFANLASELKRAEDGGADWIHVDVMDGHFVPNLTIGPPVVKAIRGATKLPLDVHLMITNPDQYLNDFADAGANYLTVHAEACTHLQRTLVQIRSLGMKAGVSLNPATPPDHLEYVLADVDLVLIMSVNPGFGGQKFIDAVVPKVRAVRNMLNAAGRTDVHVSVDGGINTKTAKVMSEAGADVLVAGKSVYGSKNVAEAIQSLRDASNSKTQSDSKIHEPIKGARHG